jgi:hypothetical protein
LPNSEWNPTVVITDLNLDPDHLLFEGIDTSQYPHFSIGEVAKIFFAKSPSWLRGQETAGKFSIQGEDVFLVRRRVAKHARYFCLEDIELMVHALAFNRVINGVRLRTTLTVLKGVGQIWGYLSV